jgi:ubiquinone/menaquinone biosynthesis C-methylase UbiE
MSETYTPGYCSNAVAFMSARTAQREAAFLFPRLKPGVRLLDIGCGPGTITAGLARAVAPGEVTGLDRAGAQLDLARENAAREGLANVRFVPGSVYTLPFADQEFDVVFAHALFEHLKDQIAALREIHRVLRPGGIVALRSPDWGGFIAHPNWPEFHDHSPSCNRLRETTAGMSTPDAN